MGDGAGCDGWTQLIGERAKEQAKRLGAIGTVGDELGGAAGGGLNAKVVQLGCASADTHGAKSYEEKALE